MNLKQRIVSTIAAGALLFGATSGMALATSTSTDTASTTLNVTCPVTSTVDVNVLGSFSVDPRVSNSASLTGGFQVIMNLTCNWSNDFEVDATIGAFVYAGTAPSGSAASFPGSHLTLTNGSGNYSGITSVLPPAGAPNVRSTVFPGPVTSDDMIVNGVFIFIPYASPGVTTATWDGNLSLLPANLAGGQYVAPLTVTLSVS
ncbi:MAG: hypothetical protein ACTHQE_12575 [Thermomicrobiales bacterium]